MIWDNSLYPNRSNIFCGLFKKLMGFNGIKAVQRDLIGYLELTANKAMVHSV